ncbi:MAG: ribonuclease III [Proteobacteria bacterium]|nr:MAG: ribonuclease III [Pseudomonadota bacterium]
MPSEALIARLGHSFRDTSLLRQALTHRSHSTPHNERLEFLGDGVLNCIIACELYDRFPGLSEGPLSRLRANLVNQEALSRLALELNLGVELRLGEGELKSGGFRRPSILADAFEAVVGAIFIDGGFEQAAAAVRRIYAPLLEELDPHAEGKDPKTLLQEHLQGRRLALPQYTVVSVHGEAHAQRFQVECAIPELNVRTLGEGSSRRSAEQSAARRAYDLVVGP